MFMPFNVGQYGIQMHVVVSCLATKTPCAFCHSYNIWRGFQIIKLFLVQFSERAGTSEGPNNSTATCSVSPSGDPTW
jgi:hypothetical protein